MARKDGVRRLREEMSQQANDVAIHDDAGLLHATRLSAQAGKDGHDGDDMDCRVSSLWLRSSQRRDGVVVVFVRNGVSME